MTEMEQKLKAAAQQYYTDGTSPMTDEEFDRAMEELRSINPNSELFTVGWGYDVNKDTTPGEKVKHIYGQAGSLSKCRTWKELPKNFQACTLLDASLKLDGLSVLLHYIDGEFVQAVTRGDGYIGIDVTNKIKNVWPHHKLKDDFEHFTGAVRGEILMSFESFKEYKEYHPDAKNPRNSVAGIINSKFNYENDLKYLDIRVYSIVGEQLTHDQVYKRLEDMQFIRNRLDKMFGSNYTAPRGLVYPSENNFLDIMNSLREEWYNEFPADGIVLTMETDGCIKTDEPSPVSASLYMIKYTYDSVAFKFKSEEKESEVIEVVWKMSKTHYAIPRVHIKPIELAGTTVEWCTGYNAEYIRTNNIGPGSIVTTEKKGEIIPNINEVIKSTQASLIDVCPDCGTVLEWNGMHLQCKNPECKNAAHQDLTVWIDNIAPVDGLGDKLRMKFLDQLYEEPSVEAIMDDPNTTYFADSIGGHEKLMREMIVKLKLSEEKIPLTTALCALNVPRLGDITAQKLAQFPDAVKTMMVSTVPLNMWVDLGTSVGQANVISFRDNLKKFKRLNYIADRIDWDITPITGGIKVAITGKLSVKRADFEKELKSHGYIPGSIAKDTQFLITDDPNSSSSKNKKADEWGITKITEHDFRNQYMK